MGRLQRHHYEKWCFILGMTKPRRPGRHSGGKVSPGFYAARVEAICHLLELVLGLNPIAGLLPGLDAACKRLRVGKTLRLVFSCLTGRASLVGLSAIKNNFPF